MCVCVYELYKKIIYKYSFNIYVLLIYYVLFTT